MSISSKLFARRLAHQFSIESTKRPFSEVQQFRALMQSFSNLNGYYPGFEVEEYHGPNHQVYFNGRGAWARTPARCELCDLMILTYSVNGGFKARLTFLQAKLSKDKHPELYTIPFYPTPIVDFKANLEQWDLLSRRPDILPVPPFRAHPLLLKGALLASVGSFGVFHKRTGGTVDFFYSSADQLSVVGSPTRKHGRLSTNLGLRKRVVHGYRETTFCRTLQSFAISLYNLEIGTPVEPVSQSVAGKDVSSDLRSWVRSALSFYIQNGEGNSVMARQLIDSLPPSEDEDIDSGSSFPSLLLIRTDFEVNDSFRNDSTR